MSTTTTSLRILMGFDGSAHAHAALRLLRDLCANQPGPPISSLTLLAVFTPLMAGDQGPLRDALANAHDSLKDMCFQVTSDFVLGYPAEKIIEYSEQQHPDLIVVGAQGLRAALGILLGGVAQQIVEYACCPVLIVRAPYTGLRRVLLATDGSQPSQQATDYLARFPLPPATNIHILHVLPPLPLPPSAEFYSRTYPLAPEVLPVYPRQQSAEELAWQKEEEKQGRAILQQASQIFKDLGREVETSLLRGDAAKEIISYAKEKQIDLIVSGSRGLNPFKGWLLGSVSRKLVHYSGCSVLIVKSRREK